MHQRNQISLGFLLIAAATLAVGPKLRSAEIYHAQGEMAGEPGTDSIILQSRLTAIPGLGADRSVPGAVGVARFIVDNGKDAAGAITTPWLKADPATDFIVRHHVRGLKPGTKYRYRLQWGPDETHTQTGTDCWFRTLPAPQSTAPVSFLLFNCMGWGQYMDGYGNRKPYTGPDKMLGYPTLEKMQAYANSNFMIGGGDLVYYDLPATDIAKTLPQLRAKWQQQFVMPRLVKLVGSLGAYWMKDDHDFRYDDADLTGPREPSAELGIRTFREQMPVVPPEDPSRPTYRTIRVGRHVQLWLLEGRDYRSPNRMEDGPEKSLWGPVQREWLKTTLRESDATWKFIVTPDPMIGPDSNRKRDNHANPLGFHYEGARFFEWLVETKLRNVILLCGDRHWQYHSIYPPGISEFSCGSVNREIAVGNPPRPGDPGSSDPERRVDQRYVTSKQDGGFLRASVDAGGRLKVELIDQEGVVQYTYGAEAGR